MTDADPTIATGNPRLDLARLYDEHARELYRYLARRPDPETAQDLVAQTFLLAWQHWDRYRPDLGPQAWLYGIAMYQVLGYLHVVDPATGRVVGNRNIAAAAQNGVKTGDEMTAEYSTLSVVDGIDDRP